MKNIIKLERHQYAPELNKLHLRNGAILPAPGVRNLSQARALFKPSKFRVIATIRTKYPDKYKSLERTYTGTVVRRKAALDFAQELRDNNPGGPLWNGEILPPLQTIVKTQIIGG